jgi:hypothetical protein
MVRVFSPFPPFADHEFDTAMRSLVLLAVLATLALLLVSVAGVRVPRVSVSHADGVLSELESETSSESPGAQCFSSNTGLATNSEEEDKLYSYTSFCEQVVGDLAEPYTKESEFREACTAKYGAALCKHQCVQLAQLFDGAIVGKAGAGQKPYGISRGSADYTITQRDCENCLRYHQCTPKHVIA